MSVKSIKKVAGPSEYRKGSTASKAGSLPDFAEVDGRRVCIRGADEIVLQCGEASITLRRNGKVIIKGTLVETRSSGLNRIKGAAVQVA